jgi:hypothetical protein
MTTICCLIFSSSVSSDYNPRSDSEHDNDLEDDNSEDDSEDDSDHSEDDSNDLDDLDDLDDLEGDRKYGDGSSSSLYLSSRGEWRGGVVTCHDTGRQADAQGTQLLFCYQIKIVCVCVELNYSSSYINNLV